MGLTSILWILFIQIEKCGKEILNILFQHHETSKKTDHVFFFRSLKFDSLEKNIEGSTFVLIKKNYVDKIS